MSASEEAPAISSRPSSFTLNLPPRQSMEALFSGEPGLSPGPMTLISNFFSDHPDSESWSFSQLLAGAVASPVTKYNQFSGKELNTEAGSDRELGFKQNRPVDLVVAQSPGLSPSGFLNSPGFFSPLQSPFGMSHQQALAHVTAQAALSQSQSYTQHIQADSRPPSLLPASTHPGSGPSLAVLQQMPAPQLEPGSLRMESSNIFEAKSVPTSLSTDKYGGDGYGWRKYGQKQVKASEYPRSYYRCTHVNCLVRKKVECSPNGQVTQITYKGQHNHELPVSNKCKKDGSDRGKVVNAETKLEPGFLCETEFSSSADTVPYHSVPSNQVSTHLVPTIVHESADDEDIDYTEPTGNEDQDEGPHPKRRNIEVGSVELPLSHKAVTESRIIVQTRSEVDLLDDGFKWRKYGQKVVRGNPNPRSYYKCTYVGCNVKKHVERSSTDPKAVITAYEGKHNHDAPTTRNRSHNTSNATANHLKPTIEATSKNTVHEDMDFERNQRQILLQWKDGQMTA